MGTVPVSSETAKESRSEQPVVSQSKVASLYWKGFGLAMIVDSRRTADVRRAVR